MAARSVCPSEAALLRLLRRKPGRRAGSAPVVPVVSAASGGEALLSSSLSAALAVRLESSARRRCYARLFASSSAAGADVSRADGAGLARAARRALEEGDLAPERWEKLARRAVELAPELTFGETSRLAAGFSTARFVHFDLFARFSSRALELLQSPPSSSASTESRSEGDAFSPSSSSSSSALATGAAAGPTASDLRRLVVSFGRARAFDAELMEELVPVIAERVEDFRPRELARIADAYARLPLQSPELFALVADALPPYLYDLAPAELVALCRAFAEAAVYSDELTDAVCAEVLLRLRSFGAAECLVFLEGLSRLRAGLPEELRAARDDAEVVSEVSRHLSQLLGSLAAPELVRVFAALVRLDHYDSRLVHRRLGPALAQKLGQLETDGHFSDLAELLHCLSLLPAQSHKTVELSLATAAALRRRLAAAAAATRGGGGGARPDPRSLSLATVALAQLELQDEDLLGLLAGAVLPGGGGPAAAASSSGSSSDSLIPLASDDELAELVGAFRLHATGELQEDGLLSPGALVAARVVGELEEEMERRGAHEVKAASAVDAAA